MGTNPVLLRPEVAATFPTEPAVNDALSSLIEVAEHTVSSTKALPPTPNDTPLRGYEYFHG